MTRYLLDMNHLGEAVGRVSIVRDRIQQLHLAGDVNFATCGPVLAELMVGLVDRKDAAAVRRRLDGLLQIVQVYPIDIASAEQYAKAYYELKAVGRALSQVDILLAALTRQFDARLLSSDKDFDALPDIQRENWLTT